MLNLHSTSESTCDSCKKLKLRCNWQSSTSFTPKCSRCTKYSLSCLIGCQDWSVSAQDAFTSSVLHGSSRSVFWGPSSNAGGHPTDLHGTDEMPPAPSPTAGQQRYQPTSGESHLDLDQNVKDHLLRVYLDECQPYFPVVNAFSLRAYPPTPLLEAAIYGMACSVNSAIVSWRDLDYIRAYIRKQLIGLFSLRTETTPQLQTVQALLIICFRAELVSTDYSDLVGLPAIATFACKLAQDLALDISLQPGVDGTTEDEPLRRSIWKGCLFLDVYMAACFGHPPSIDPDKWVPLQIYTAEPVDPSNWALAAFNDLILLSRDLHQILFTYYGVQQFSIGELWRGAVTTLQALNESEQRMSARIQAYDLDTRHVLEMYGRNNRLLLARGIKLNMAHLPVELSNIPDLKSLLDEQTELVIHEALLTLSVLSREFLQSPYPRMGFPLYFIVRALFLAVEYANTLNHSASRPSSLRQRLLNAIDLAKHFTDVLLEPNKWGTEWCQGNTMRGVLSHLSSELSVTQWPPDIPSNHYDTTDFEPLDSYFDAELISGFFAPANWDALIEQYGFDSWLLSAYPGS